MQLLGYALSAFGPNYITWFFFEKKFHRKNIPTPIMALLPGILGLLVTLQTQFAYQVDLNSLVALASTFLLTFCYRESWFYRAFISLAMFVCGVISEGSSWLISRMFVVVKDMNRVNEETYFAAVALLGIIIEAIYIIIALYIIKLFRSVVLKSLHLFCF